MKNYILKITVFLLLFVLFFLISKRAIASEGTIELTSRTGEQTRCYVASLRMQNLEYKMLFSCKYLIYPVDETIFNYVMWAQPKDGGKAIKLGTIGLGKGEFKTRTPFTSLFVTTESNKDTKTPSGKIVMSGNVQPIKFLEEEKISTQTPSPEGEKNQKEETQKSEEKKELSTKDKFILAFKRAGIAALLALVCLIGIVFVVSRSRG